MSSMKKWSLAMYNATRGVMDREITAYIALYALLMKENELNGEPVEAAYSLEYLALTYGKILKVDELISYISELNDTRWHMDGMLCDGAVSLFHNKGAAYDDGVRAIFGGVYDADFQSTEELFEAAKFMLYSVMTNGNIKGDISSGESIHKLEAGLLDCKSGMTIYDGFCGYGLSAVTAAQCDGGIIYLRDINVLTTAIASIVAILGGVKIGRIQYGDSFAAPVTLDEKYDRVIAEPVFYGRGIGKGEVENINSESCLYAEIQNIQTLPLRHMAAMIKEGGIGVVLVPMGLLFSAGRIGEVRTRMLRSGMVQGVIELPSGALIGTNIKTALLVIGPHNKTKNVYMLSAEKFFSKNEKKQFELSDESIKRIVTMYRNQEIEDGCANWVSLDEIADKNYDLCPMTYMQQSALDVIQIEDIEKYQSRYKQVFEELMMLDKELAELRENL